MHRAALWLSLRAVLRVALPVVALALLLGLVLLARRIDPLEAFRHSAPEVQELGAEEAARGVVLSAPLADDGWLSVTAARVAPDGDEMIFEEVRASLAGSDGRATRISAASARLKAGGRELRLRGNVRITLPDGQLVESERLEIDLSTRRAVSPGPVQVSGPLGRISAASATVDLAPGRERIVFTGAVKLLYAAQEDAR